MNIAFARALAHTEIYRCSDPTVKYHKAAVVPDETGDDWEPIQSPPEGDVPIPQAAVIAESDDLTNGYDCGCDGVAVTQPTQGEVDVVES